MNEQAQRERERLRDEFAAAALTGLAGATGDVYIALCDRAVELKITYEANLARIAYVLADAALAHRDANPLPAPGPTPTRAPQ